MLIRDNDRLHKSNDIIKFDIFFAPNKIIILRNFFFKICIVLTSHLSREFYYTTGNGIILLFCQFLSCKDQNIQQIYSV